MDSVEEEKDPIELDKNTTVVVSAIKGWKKHMGNCHTIVTTIEGIPNCQYLGLFDGHGGKPRYKEDTKVEAQRKGGSAWCKGVVTKQNADGSCDLKYDDGTPEQGVRPENIKRLEAACDNPVAEVCRRVVAVVRSSRSRRCATARGPPARVVSPWASGLG
jgi:hypothetical protein